MKRWCKSAQMRQQNKSKVWMAIGDNSSVSKIYDGAKMLSPNQIRCRHKGLGEVEKGRVPFV